MGRGACGDSHASNSGLRASPAFCSGRNLVEAPRPSAPTVHGLGVSGLISIRVRGAVGITELMQKYRNQKPQNSVC